MAQLKNNTGIHDIHFPGLRLELQLATVAKTGRVWRPVLRTEYSNFDILKFSLKQ